MRPKCLLVTAVISIRLHECTNQVLIHSDFMWAKHAEIYIKTDNKPKKKKQKKKNN